MQSEIDDALVNELCRSIEEGDFDGAVATLNIMKQRDVRSASRTVADAERTLHLNANQTVLVRSRRALTDKL
jgi:hypothetical protein